MSYCILFFISGFLFAGGIYNNSKGMLTTAVILAVVGTLFSMAYETGRRNREREDSQ